MDQLPDRAGVRAGERGRRPAGRRPRRRAHLAGHLGGGRRPHRGQADRRGAERRPRRAVRAGRLPQGVRPAHVFGGAALSGIGFTVSLLIARLAFEDRLLRDEAIVGVLLGAVLATVLGWIVFRAAALPCAACGRRTCRASSTRRWTRTPTTSRAPATRRSRSWSTPTSSARSARAPRASPRSCGSASATTCATSSATCRSRTCTPTPSSRRGRPSPPRRQGRFWEMHDRLFEHQGELEYEDIAGYAAEIGLDVERFLRDVDDEETAARVRADVRSAEASGARGTPTFYVNGRRHVGPHDTRRSPPHSRKHCRRAGRPRCRRGVVAAPPESWNRVPNYLDSFKKMSQSFRRDDAVGLPAAAARGRAARDPPRVGGADARCTPSRTRTRTRSSRPCAGSSPRCPTRPSTTCCGR